MPELEDDDKKGKKGDKKGGGKEDSKKGKKDDGKGGKGGKDKGGKPGKDEDGKGKSPKGAKPALEIEKGSPSGVSLAEDKTEKSDKSEKSKKSEKSEKSEGSEGAPAKKGPMKPSDKGKKGLQKIPPPSESMLKAIADDGPVYAERYYNDEYEDDQEQRTYVEVEMFEHRLSNTGFGSPRGRGRGRGRGGPVISARGGRTGSPPPLHHESRSVHDEYYYEQCDPEAQQQLQCRDQQQFYGREREDQRQQPMRRSVTQVDAYYDESSGSHHFEGSYCEIADDAPQGGRPALQRVQAVPRQCSPLRQEPIVAESSCVAMAMNVGHAGPVLMQQQRSRSRGQLPPAGPTTGQRSRPSSRQSSRQASATSIIVPVAAIIVATDNADNPPPAGRRSPRGQRSRDWIDP